MTSSVMTRRPRRWACVEELLEVVERAVVRVDVGVVGDVVAVVLERRRVERQQPDGGDAEVLRGSRASAVRPRKSPMPSPLLSWKARTWTS